jgi:hypothetical protein
LFQPVKVPACFWEICRRGRQILLAATYVMS